MFQAHHKVIDGFDYKVTEMPALKAFHTFVDLTKIVGESYAHLAAKAEESTPQEVVGECVRLLIKNLDHAKSESILKEMAGVTMFCAAGESNHMPLSQHLNMHFAGKMGRMVKWLHFALEVQYGNLLEALSDFDG